MWQISQEDGTAQLQQLSYIKYPAQGPSWIIGREQNINMFSTSYVADACIIASLALSLLPIKDCCDFEHIFILWQKYSTAVGDMFSSCKVWLLQLTLWLVQHLQTLANITTHWQLSGNTLCMTCYCPNITPIRRAGDVTTLLIVSNQE